MAKRSLLAQNAGHEGWPAPGVQPDAALEGYLLAQPGCLQELQGDLQSCLQGCLQALHQALFGRARASAHCGPPATGEDSPGTESAGHNGACTSQDRTTLQPRNSPVSPEISDNICADMKQRVRQGEHDSEHNMVI